MEDHRASLWLHAYAGKENGLMVVGTPDTIRELAQKLLVATDAQSTVTSAVWPQEIACPPTIGPYVDVPDFTLSFHLKGEISLETVTPLRRRNLIWPVFVSVAFLSVIGAITLWQWVVGHVL
jgi:hypothetical protein